MLIVGNVLLFGCGLLRDLFTNSLSFICDGMSGVFVLAVSLLSDTLWHFYADLLSGML